MLGDLVRVALGRAAKPTTINNNSMGMSASEPLSSEAMATQLFDAGGDVSVGEMLACSTLERTHSYKALLAMISTELMSPLVGIQVYFYMGGKY